MLCWCCGVGVVVTDAVAAVIALAVVAIVAVAVVAVAVVAAVAVVGAGNGDHAVAGIGVGGIGSYRIVLVMHCVNCIGPHWNMLN